jgi:hypothetical protein
MKMINYLYTIVLFAGVFIISSCKKDIDNVTPQPVITIDSISIDPAQSAMAGKIGGATSLLAPYNSSVTIPFHIIAQGKIEQVDYKVTGSSTYSVINSSNNPVTTQSVPFDWVGLMTIRSGFDSDKAFNFSVIISNLTQKTYITIQAIDKNGLKFFITVIIYPSLEGTAISGQVLYSQNATAADAGGAEVNRKMFLASSNGSAYDTASAKVNNVIDISYADSAGSPILVSPEYRKASTNNAAGVINLTNGLSTTFMLSSFDISAATIEKLQAVSFAQAKPYIKITAGNSYLFKNASGAIGIIKINSIANGVSSMQPNAVVDVDVKSFIPDL